MRSSMVSTVVPLFDNLLILLHTIGLNMISGALPAAASANNLQIEYPIRILVAGGAVSVLKYQSRPTTHDVNFYHPDEGLRRVLVQLGCDVARIKEWQGAFYWFNDAVENIINGDPEYSGVFARSLAGGETVYASDILLLIAVDPLWQLHRKVSRISKGLRLGTGSHEEDMADALYLLGLFQRHEGRPCRDCTGRPNLFADRKLEQILLSDRKH
jgi:hypothetical protein